MDVAIWIIAVCQLVIAIGWIAQLVYMNNDKKRIAKLFEFDKERQEWARQEQARMSKWWKQEESTP